MKIALFIKDLFRAELEYMTHGHWDRMLSTAIRSLQAGKYVPVAKSDEEISVHEFYHDLTDSKTKPRPMNNGDIIMEDTGGQFINLHICHAMGFAELVCHRSLFQS